MRSVRPKIDENMPVCVLGSGTYQQHPTCPAPHHVDHCTDCQMNPWNYPGFLMVASPELVASELRVPVVRSNFCVGSYQFLRAAGAPVRRRRGAGPLWHAKIDFKFFSAHTDHYENIFEALSLSARTFTKIFSKRFFGPRGPFRLASGVALLGVGEGAT